MKNKFKLILVIFMCSLFLTNCKKGEKDPAISLRTRKARLTGDWNMSHGNANLTWKETGKPSYNEAYSFQGTTLTLNTTEAGGPLIVYKGSYSLGVKFYKTGKFEMTENFGGTLFSASGTWNFTGRLGDNKNKEEIIIILDVVNTGASNEHIFNKFRTEFTYKLKELSNKEIILMATTKPYINSNGDVISYSSEYTFKQD